MKEKQYSIIHVVPCEKGWELRPENVHAGRLRGTTRFKLNAIAKAEYLADTVQLWEEVPEDE